MTRTKVRTIVIIFVLAMAAGAVVLFFLLRSGYSLPNPGFEVGIIMSLLTVLLCVLGLSVRKLKAGEPTWMTPIGAARTAAGALASSRGGALVAGVVAAHLAVVVANYHNEALALHLWVDVYSLLSAVMVVMVALWVESICSLDGGEEPKKRGRRRAEGTGRAAPAPA